MRIKTIEVWISTITLTPVCTGCFIHIFAVYYFTGIDNHQRSCKTQNHTNLSNLCATNLQILATIIGNFFLPYIILILKGEVYGYIGKHETSN